MDEKELAKKIKNLDFSHFSAEHKEQLWKALNNRSNRRVLHEHELDFAAAGITDLITELPDSGIEFPGLGTVIPGLGTLIPDLGVEIPDFGTLIPEPVDRICAKCGSKNVSGKGLCADCRYMNKL